MSTRVLRVLVLALLASCGGGGSSGPPPALSKFMYATAFQGPNFSNAYTYGFGVYTNGALSALPGFAPVPAGDYGGLPVVITHDSKLLYAPNNDETANIAAFNINADGSLTGAVSPSFAYPLPLGGLTAHPSADFLYASSTGGVVSVLAVDTQTGALEQTSSVELGDSNHTVLTNSAAVITPDGHYLYQADSCYPGAVVTPPFQAQVAGFAIDANTGALTAVPASPVSPAIPANAATVLAVDRAGKFLFVSYSFAEGDVPKGGVVVFSIDASTGALTAVPQDTISLAGAPDAVAIDASGKFLIIAASSPAATCSLAVLSIDPNAGSLTAVPGSPFGPLATYCGSITADPSLPFVYVASASQSGPGAVFTLALDQTSGALAAASETKISDNESVGVSFIALTH
jgi:6-phosphogluconolactonase (cycloisomerase 2 family)